MARDLVGKVVGAYRLGDVLGRGRTGTVYEAEHAASGRKVAVKVFHADFSRDKNAAVRLSGELQKLTSIKHPYLVEVLDTGTVESKGRRYVYLVMERLAGRSLKDHLCSKKGQPLPLAFALQVASDVGAALNAIHARGAAHQLLDAGAVFLVGASAEDGAAEAEVRLLELGTALLVKAAKEEGDAPPPRDDVRALALLLEEMLGGSESGGAHRPVLPLRQVNREVPVHVDAAIRRALGEVVGNGKFSTVSEFVGAFLGSEVAPQAGVWSADGSAPIPSRSSFSMGWLVLLLAVLSGAVGLWLHEWGTQTAPGGEPEGAAVPVVPGKDADAGLPAPEALAAEPDLSARGPEATPPARPARPGPLIPPLRGSGSDGTFSQAEVQQEGPAVPHQAAPAQPGVEPLAVPQRPLPKRTGPPIPPLRLRL